ncbi:MAG: PAS domain S-box-containing protein [Planctomycetota bacterium]|jgi:PAS domain S-box-containing protein
MARPTHTSPRDFALSASLLILASLGGWFLGNEVDKRASDSFNHRIDKIAERVAVQIELYTEAQLLLLSFAAEEALGMDNELESGFRDVAITLVDFRRRADSLVRRRPGFQAINWVSLEGVIEVTSPLQSNEAALRQNLLQHPNADVRATFASAIQMEGGQGGELSSTSIISLFQGGLGFSVFHPVHREGDGQIGVLNASFRLKDLLEECVPEQSLEGIAEYAVLNMDGEILYANFDATGEVDWRHSSSIDLRLVPEQLIVRARPTPAWLESGLTEEQSLLSGIGLALGCLLAALSWIMVNRGRGIVRSEWRLKLALNGASLGVWDLDVAQGVLHLNQEWLSMLGLKQSDGYLGLAEYRSLVHPDDLQIVEGAMDRHLRGESPTYQTEHRIRSGTGEWIWVLDIGSVVERGSDGSPKRVAGTQLDMTDTRRAELELERTSARYRSIFEHSPIGLLEQDMSEAKQRMDELRAQGVVDLREYFVANPDAASGFQGLSKTLDINHSFLRMFEAKSPEEYKANIAKMVDGRANTAYQEEIIALYSGASTFEVDFPLSSLDGTELLYTMRLTVAPGCLDDLSSVFVSLVDNTRRIREEEERRLAVDREREAQKSESLALLAGGVAHDFNNLLVPIIGNIELVMQKLPVNSEMASNLLRAEQASQRAAELARQMQIYSGRGQVQSEAFNMNALVLEMNDLLGSSLPGKVSLESELHDGVLGIDGDPTQVRQLVMNLVLNAADAIGRVPGVVSVRTGYAEVMGGDLRDAFTGPDFALGKCIYLEVEDTGKGLEEETRKRMFEPFFSTKAAGRGLGMSVVLGIVRSHQGALVVESAPGIGTRIRAYLPISTRSISAAPKLGPRLFRGTADPQQNVTVLLADDEPGVLRFASAALASVNVHAVCVEDGSQAVTSFEELQRVGKTPDLVLLDATMPVMGGIEAMLKIRELAPKVAIILSSGYTLEGVASRAAETERCWFLPKPYGVIELTNMVSTVLGETEREQEPT